MGGGDLNMKKHFHPLTMENLERVWKAEEKYKEEMKKIEERKKEIEEERSKQMLIDQATSTGVMKKKDERLEWMYSANRANNEDFLLGKQVTNSYIENTAYLEKQKVIYLIKIDKIEKKIEEKTRIFGFRGQKSAVIDLERKIKEDPLFLIKKRELAATKELISNSVRIQQIAKTSERKGDETTRIGRKYGMTPINRNDGEGIGKWDTPMRDMNDNFKTPRNSHYNRNKHRNQDFSHRSERRNYDRNSSRSYKRDRYEKKVISDEDKNEKLKKMMSNAEWRESTRKNNVEKMKVLLIILNKLKKEEAEIEKKLEEKLNKLRNNNLSTPIVQQEIIKNAKMGNYSSKRYVNK